MESLVFSDPEAQASPLFKCPTIGCDGKLVVYAHNGRPMMRCEQCSYQEPYSFEFDLELFY